MPTPTHNARPIFGAGVTLLVVTLLAIVAMAHHPTVGTNTDIGHAIDSLRTLSRLSAFVHGALIAMMLVTLYCLVEFVSHRGAARPAMKAGTIAYAIGVVVMIGAALVSGFVVGEVARWMPRDTPVDLQSGRQLLLFCGILNQACADCAVVLMSAGIGLWSIDLLRDRGVPRLVGLLGCVVAVVPIVGLPSGTLHLDVHGMLAVVMLQATWNLAIGGLMIRGGRRVVAND